MYMQIITALRGFNAVSNGVLTNVPCFPAAGKVSVYAEIIQQEKFQGRSHNSSRQIPTERETNGERKI